MVAKSSGRMLRARSSNSASLAAGPWCIKRLIGYALRGFHVVHHHDFLEERLISNAQNLVQLLLRRNRDRPYPRVTKQSRGLPVGQGRIDRNDNCADRQARKIGNRPLGPVLAQNRNPVALADPPILQAPAPLRPRSDRVPPQKWTPNRSPRGVSSREVACCLRASGKCH